MRTEETKSGESEPTKEEVVAFVMGNRTMRRIFLRTRIEDVPRAWVPLTRKEEQELLERYDVELCEGCEALATAHDSEGAPLCEGCVVCL